jgi:hypothetical protein
MKKLFLIDRLNISDTISLESKSSQQDLTQQRMYLINKFFSNRCKL